MRRLAVESNILRKVVIGNEVKFAVENRNVNKLIVPSINRHVSNLSKVDPRL